MKKPKIILASASPRRRKLLSPFYKLKIIPANCDESVKRGENARAYVKRIAREKWVIVARRVKRLAIVLAADTTVVLQGKILGKPRNKAEAKRMLSALSGRSHQVMTGVCLGWSSNPKLKKQFVVSTRVKFKKILKEHLEYYLKSGEWKGKAGSYAIQGKAAQFVAEYYGSLTNIVGLPVDETRRAINKALRCDSIQPLRSQD